MHKLLILGLALLSAPAYAAVSPALQSVLTNVGVGALAVGASILLIHAALFKIRLMRKEAAAFDKLPECSVCFSKPVVDAKTGVCAGCLDAFDPATEWTAEVMQTEETVEECWRCGSAPVFPVGAMDWTCPSCAAPNPQPEGVVDASLSMSPEEEAAINAEYARIEGGRMREILADDPNAFDDDDIEAGPSQEYLDFCEARTAEIEAMTEAEREELAVEQMWEKLAAHPDDLEEFDDESPSVGRCMICGCDTYHRDVMNVLRCDYCDSKAGDIP